MNEEIKKIEKFEKPERQIGLPEETVLDPRAFCKMRFSPILATGVILDIIREHFGNPSSITDPMCQNYVWTPNTDSNILIETNTNENIEQIGQRPAILVKRDKIQYQRYIIMDRVINTGVTCPPAYSVEFTGSHTVFSIATKAAHADVLANEATTLLLQYSPVIRSSLCFNDFRLSGIDEVQLSQENNHYFVASTFSYAGIFNWELKTNEPKLRHVRADILFGYEKR
jgi:hypothetical protein